MTNKPTIAILGDGYQTSAEFHAHATRVRDGILADPAFAGRVEVVPVFRASQRVGLPTAPDDTTAYRSYMLRNGSGNLGGSIGNIGLVRDDAATVSASWVVMLWNTGEPFGTILGYTGIAIVGAARTDAAEVTLHELGHSVGGLADEYRTRSSFAPPPGEVGAPNLSIYADGRKWANLLGSQAADGQVVGAFEGANLYPQGVYRPCADTRMRRIGKPFSPVDILAIHRAIDAAWGRMPGDADRDGDVDFADLNLVLSEFGERGLGLAGDVNSDGRVDFADLSQVQSNYGAQR